MGRLMSKKKAKKLADEQKLKPAAKGSLADKMRNEILTKHEYIIFKEGVFNASFLYLGSTKIFGGIGKGLAEAMATLKQHKK